ncbi:MAG TPA: sigma-70 family RNA polymerase sigma factor [Pseudolysinimonas sp.]|nr:sigma-70 family RNA polymerase sigma factor [Pseudolysinimonas sp.]
MDEQQLWAQQFELHRARLSRSAQRMLGSAADAEDAVQGAWLKLSRSDPTEIDNLAAWLTTVVARICLDMLRARSRRAEEPLEMRSVDGPSGGRADPEQQALVADSVGLALQLVLDVLSPDERIAFVLHDIFGLSFDDIAAVVDRTPVATRKLASRARQRVRGQQESSEHTARASRALIDAFLAAARGEDMHALVAILHPDAELHVDTGAAGGGVRILRGREAVAGQLATFHAMATTRTSEHIDIDGVPSLLNSLDGVPLTVMSFTIDGGQILRIEVLSDPERRTKDDPALDR